MKNIKIFLSAMVVCAMSYGSYTAYEAATMTDEERALMENVEALTSGENENSFHCYSILTGSGQAVNCATCKLAAGTPPWYHFGSRCYR